ncbi:MAG: NAD(P)/FAD-dependent oxidoreductase, partial [Pseudomonadota bacterium]
AFKRLIESNGGQVVVNADVTKILVRNKSAYGVQVHDGSVYEAKKAVICNVTPTQLYGRLLPPELVPPATKRMANRYSYGRAGMQMHIAMSEPPRWRDERLNGVGLVHITPGLDGVSRSINEADCGLLPSDGTIVVGQPAETDPTRCPPGQSILWIQLLELPRRLRGDAAGAITVPADGGWTDQIRDAYAERILHRLGEYITNLDGARLAMTALSPTNLEQWNMNLVGGDPYSGSSSIDQFHLFRPFGSGHNHRTPLKKLFHIGASTHPGPGLSGMSGHMVASQIKP